MTDYVEELRRIYNEIFDSEVVDTFISDDICFLNPNTTEVEILFNKNGYERYVQIKPGIFRIKGCLKCILDFGITVRQQDFPGWIGNICNCDIIIIGLEAKLEKDMDAHIAYNQYPGGKVHDLFYKYRLFISNIRERSYITDIAKCTSSDFKTSRNRCFKSYFLKELENLLNINPNFTIILQGGDVEKLFLKNKKKFRIDYDFTLKGKRSMLFKRGRLKYLDFDVPLIYFPHTSGSNNPEWKEIREKKLKEIKEQLKALLFVP